jgi:hypothetical protein
MIKLKLKPISLSILVFILVGLFNTQSLSQTAAFRITVKDQNGNGIPYVALFNPAKRTGNYTEDNGQASLKADINDSIMVSCIGYADTIIVLNDTSEYIVILYEKVNSLNEVLIKAKRLKGKKKKLGSMHLPIAYRFYHSSKGGILAMQLRTGGIGDCRIERVIVPVVYGSHGKVRLRIFQSVQGVPGIDILETSPIANVRRLSNRVIFDVSQLNITFTNKGIFIAIEILEAERDEKGLLSIGFSYGTTYENEHTYNRFYSSRWQKQRLGYKNGTLRIGADCECTH